MSQPSKYETQEGAVALLAVDHNVLTHAQALQVISRARADKTDPINVLIAQRIVPPARILEALAKEMGLPFIDLNGPIRTLSINRDVLAKANSDWLLRFNALPMVDGAGEVTVVCADPGNSDLRQFLDVNYPGHRRALGERFHIRQRLAAEASSLSSQNLPSQTRPEPVAARAETPNLTAAGPVLQWIERMLENASALNASDLHFDLLESDRLQVRFRIDGELLVQPFPLAGREREVIGALMTRSGMDAQNLRVPQDGSFSFTATGRRVDVRAAMVPQIENRPKLVLRTLDPGNLKRLDELGFGDDQLAMMRRVALQSQGLMIVAGPTGSGKTTSLFAMLQEVITPAKHVVTIENPVEYRIDGITQIPVREDLGERSVTFEKALKAVMRLDPDIILVGEIRDVQTAAVATNAAMTGHLVLTSLHASSAAGIFTRLSEIGIPPFIVADALSLGVSQRLVRRLHTCAMRYPATGAEKETMEAFGLEPVEFLSRAVGCPACSERGYRGRLAVAELLLPSKDTYSAVISRAPAHVIAESAGDGHVAAQRDASRMLREGMTTLSEVIRALTIT